MDKKELIPLFENLSYTDLLPNGSIRITEEFFKKAIELIVDFLKTSNNRKEKVVDFHHPHEVENLIDFGIHDAPQSLQKVLNDCKQVLDFSVKTGHPRFFNQLFAGVDIVALVGDWLSSVTNTSVYTYEVAPMYILMENCIFDKLREIIGWKEPCDGLFSPGGSISNLYAIQLARYHYFPQVKAQGMYGLPKLVAFSSKHNHYSIKKSMSILGMGTENLREVPVDSRGRLIPDELESMIAKSFEAGERPFIVCLTSGTTVLGAFDHINPVADICEKYNLWLHVDAAWGGSALFSKRVRYLMDGIERSDSITWNPHKMMGALLQASVILLKKRGLLHACNSMSASYLFQKDKFYDLAYDIGDKTIQCGRHVDVCKVWLMWKAKGLQGFEKHVDHMINLTEYFYSRIKVRKNFEVVLEDPEFANVCFWYIPSSLKNLDKNSDDYKKKLNKVAPKIKEKMILDGSMMIGYQPLDQMPNFFRIVFANAATQYKDLDYVIDQIEHFGSIYFDSDYYFST